MASTATQGIAIGYNAVVGTLASSQKGQMFAGTNAYGNNTLQIGSGSHVVYANTFTPTSDERLKKDIYDIELGLDFVNALRPVSFTWREPANAQHARRQFGLIAQEVKATMEQQFGMPPHGCYTDAEDGSWSLNYDSFVAPLVKAVQELSAMVTRMQAEVAALKAG